MESLFSELGRESDGDNSRPLPNSRDEVPRFVGRRKRMKDRVLRFGSHSLTDAELLEAVLFFCTSRKDTKPIAKQTLKQHAGSLSKILAPPSSSLQKEFYSIGGNLHFLVSIVRELMSRAMFDSMMANRVNLTESWDSIIEYIRFRLSDLTKEGFLVLIMNAKNVLMDEAVLSHGTVDQVSAYPRKVLEKSIEKRASSVILAQNHPSGDPFPSKGDIMLTGRIVDLLRLVSVSVLDHVIVGSSGYFSFREESLIEVL